jgi:hypothetical protein
MRRVYITVILLLFICMSIYSVNFDKIEGIYFSSRPDQRGVSPNTYISIDKISDYEFFITYLDLLGNLGNSFAAYGYWDGEYITINTNYGTYYLAFDSGNSYTTGQVLRIKFYEPGALRFNRFVIFYKIDSGEVVRPYSGVEQDPNSPYTPGNDIPTRPGNDIPTNPGNDIPIRPR